MAAYYNKPAEENSIQEEKDINDVFLDIFLNENNSIKQGYDNGYTVGSSEFNVEAYHLGYHRGAELGAEIGYYSAIIKTYQELFNQNKINNEKALKTLQSLTQLMENFPTFNDPNNDILKLLTDIRAKFRKFCALLKIDIVFSDNADHLSF